MSHESLKHGTVTLERSFRTGRSRVFAAWSDPELRRIWGTPSDEIELRIDAADFSVGGEDVSTCLAGGEPLFVVRGRYHDIVPDRRIVYTEIMANLEATEGACLVSAEFLDAGAGCRLVLTLQTVALDGADVLAGVQAGWESALQRLDTLLM
jgi:uncharacterized protein YndB with AHSA1/START domain